MKNVLFIVYYFPPMGGSGVQRPLKFVKYLKNFGWNPIVLCPEPGMYLYFDEALKEELDEISPEIYRVQPSTPFHVAGKKSSSQRINIPEFASEWSRRFMRLFMFPDNKKGWIKPAISEGERIIREKKIDLIFSTAPPFSNHIIGASLKRKFKIPLVLDYRDAWQHNHFFTDMYAWQKKKMKNLEAECLKEADAIVGLDAEMLNSINASFPEINQRNEVIAHGFDTDDFSHPQKATLDYKEGKLNILYSGLFYEQNQPDVFFEGIKSGIKQGLFSGGDIHLHFQGGLSSRIKKLIRSMNLVHLVSDYEYVPHNIAVANLLKADLLWMISNFEPSFKQVKSGKLFEYFGSGKPILGILNPGESSKLLKEYNLGYVADVSDSQKIAVTISELIKTWKNKEFQKANPAFLQRFDRKLLTQKLANLFDEISS